MVPQCLPGHNEDDRTWLPADLNVLLDHVLAEFPCDPRRVYLTGFSMGGYGSWAWGASDPDRFAAVVAVAGGLGKEGPKDVTPNLAEWAAALASVPVWTWHGSDDRVVPTDRSERLIDLIRSHPRSRARTTILPGRGHDSQLTAFDDPRLIRWLVSREKTSDPGE